MWHGQKKRQINQRNRIESLDIYPHNYSQLIFNKEEKVIQLKPVFQQTVDKLTSTCKKKKKKNLYQDLTSFTKIKSKWIIDLNIKCKIITPLEDNTGENLNDLGMVMSF